MTEYVIAIESPYGRLEFKLFNDLGYTAGCEAACDVGTRLAGLLGDNYVFSYAIEAKNDE
jgi:hypothetical protein